MNILNFTINIIDEKNTQFCLAKSSAIIFEIAQYAITAVLTAINKTRAKPGNETEKSTWR